MKNENKMKVKLDKVSFYHSIGRGNTRPDRQKGKIFMENYRCPRQ